MTDNKALLIFEKTSRLNPNYLPLRILLASHWYEKYEYQKAIKHLQGCLKINPNLSGVHSLLYLAYKSACLWTEADNIIQVLDAETDEDSFVSLIRSESPAQNLKVAQKTAESISTATPKHLFSHQVSSSSKIRLGYLSGDFYNNAVGHLISSIFALHNRESFEIYVYSYGPNDHSSWRDEVEKGADLFKDVASKTDLEIAQTIYDDQINILIDLKGFTHNARQAICAMRPAPVQVTYLGFPGSTGALFFDYTIVDKIVVPPQKETHFSEKLVYLPSCYQMNSPLQPSITPKYKRQDFGLPPTKIIFSSFNQSFKFDPIMFTTWIEILNAVPDSVLWLWDLGKEMRESLKLFAISHGLSPNRLIFSSTLDKSLHINRLQLADLALDTRIYNGHTTTSDNLRAGVPVITLLGTHFASRVAASILTTYGIPELITYNLDSYKRLAIKLAKNKILLNKLKKKIEKLRSDNPLFDTQKSVKNLEAIYKKMWENFCDNI